MRIAIICSLAALLGPVFCSAQALEPVPFTDVRLTDSFWAPRLETNRTVTIPHNFDECEKTGRISNFLKAAGKMKGAHEGYFFNDSDVYKVMEAASYSLASHPDAKLDAYMDNLIATLAAAQRPDGYLNTYYTLKEGLEKRWSNTRDMHELYCAGHLFEAAVAHHRATGKKTLLDVATKFADYIDSVFGPDKRHDVGGHEEVEIGLVKLYKETGEKRYLKLAQFFIDTRGTTDGRQRWGDYHQDQAPLLQQDEAVGHAVRFGYFMCGASDIVLNTGDRKYVPALDRLWSSVVNGKLYVTGAIGARAAGEAFGPPYDLPNESAYAETCAGISNAMWNERMDLIHADARHIDVLERVLYNGFLSGVSLSGDRFFYVNPLASRGQHHRQPWFGCACCPPNVARLMASLPGYFYATSADTLYVNLYASGTAKVKVGGQAFEVKQETLYPWDGRIRLTVLNDAPVNASIAMRIPAWCDKPSMIVRGGRAEMAVSKGYATVAGPFKNGDTIELNLPMEIKRVYADPRVKADVGRVAIQRGPVVYCLEAVDNGGEVYNRYLPKDAPMSAQYRGDLLRGVTVITGQAMERGIVGEPGEPVNFTAIPYYAWDNRQPGQMEVWMAEQEDVAVARQRPTAASMGKVTVSFRGNGDGPQAINDLLEPGSSKDMETPRHTFWPHKGTSEWAELTLKEKTRVSGVSIYWFDDTGVGECRVPESWTLLYRDGTEWKPVSNASAFGVAKDTFNKVSFDPVETTSLRIEVKLRPRFSTGILEWKTE